MDFFPPAVSEYVEAHTSPESNVLRALNHETNISTVMPQMLAGHLQGAFLSMMSCMAKPKTILEIGTFTGYSAICLAKGLQEGGQLHTIDIDEEIRKTAQKYITKAGVEDKIVLHTGNAADIIPTLNLDFDLVFIDADKINYHRYYDMVFDHLKPGGYIIADNVLWSGKVVENAKDEDTQALIAFNKKVQNDTHVENVLVPIRDGIMVIRKLGSS